MTDNTPEPSGILWLLPIVISLAILAVLVFANDQVFCNVVLILTGTFAKLLFTLLVVVVGIRAALLINKKNPAARRWRRLAYSTTATVVIVLLGSSIMAS